MKRFKEPFDNGGMPFQNEDWNTAQDQPLKAAESIVAGLREPCIISGGVISQITPNITMSGGYCFLNGVIMEFDAINNSPYGYLIEGTPTNEPRTALSGATVSDFTTTRKAVYSATPATGSDESIVLNATPYQYLNQVQFRQNTPTGSMILLHEANSKLFGYNLAISDGTGLGTGWWSGFAVCNGQNGTPDLTGKFVRGTNSTPKATGGQSSLNLEHNHKTIATGGDSGYASAFDEGGTVQQIFTNSGTSGSGATDVSKNFTNNTQYYSDKSLSSSQNIEPPYYTMFYMLRL